MGADIRRSFLKQDRGFSCLCTRCQSTQSHSRRLCTLKIFGTSEILQIPIEVTTKVLAVRQLVSSRVGLEPESLTFVVKSASSTRVLRDSDEIPSQVIVRGPLNCWQKQKAVYPHPHCIIGAGHGGLKQGLAFLKDGIQDFAIYDKLGRIGGAAWVINANPTSKLQTELGVYHLQYDPDCLVPKDMKTWPTRDDLLDHFERVCREFGLLGHIHLNTEVTRIDRINLKMLEPEASPRKYVYKVSVKRPVLKEADTADSASKHKEEGESSANAPALLDPLGLGFDELELESPDPEDIQKPEEIQMLDFSTIECYPGGLTDNLRMEFRGEDIFEGNIGYGMFDEFDYTSVANSAVAIFGMGAFGVENVRTCLEHGAAKVTIICRRRNIAIPRVVDWFINQSLYPPPAAMVLDAMKPMYNFLDVNVWDFYAVQANSDRTNATIRQKSRFGIGDFYFLATCYGKAETVVGEIKRLRATDILLESSESVVAEHFIKVLGFKADPKIDKLFSTREMVGFFPNGDWRTWVCCEFPGIDAGRFGGTSLSPSAITNAEMMKWCINYPREMLALLDANVLPRQKADSKTGRPAYQFEPRAGAQITMVTVGSLPGLAELPENGALLKRQKMLTAHPMEVYVDECANEWYDYCQMSVAMTGPFPPTRTPTNTFESSATGMTARARKTAMRWQHELRGGPDACRALPCDACGAGTVLPQGHSRTASEAQPTWHCASCSRDTLSGDLHRSTAEAQLTHRMLLELKPPRGVPKASPEELVALAGDVRSRLGDEHWISAAAALVLHFRCRPEGGLLNPLSVACGCRFLGWLLDRKLPLPPAPIVRTPIAVAIDCIAWLGGFPSSVAWFCWRASKLSARACAG
ncbi:unnamed protein product [Symbiodinium sp. CCMP2592]|nr:unnamed protein product [Symbiodinium sp. CCMP2592]